MGMEFINRLFTRAGSKPESACQPRFADLSCHLSQTHGLSTALTLQKDKALQPRNGFADSISKLCRKSEITFQHFIPNESIHGGQNSPVNTVYIVAQ